MKSLSSNDLSASLISREMGVVAAAFKRSSMSICAVACTRYSTTHYTRIMTMGGSSGPGM